jgi:cysteinyl-tRNA synthetase
MSKSKVNQYFLRELIKKGINPTALRYLLLSTHYRKMLNFSFETLDQAESSLERINDFLYELDSRSFDSGQNPLVKKIIKKKEKNFVESLSDDLNISMALTAVFELIRDVNKLLAQNQIYEIDAEMIRSTLRKWDRVLGVLPKKEDKKLENSIKKKIKLREKARKEKNYEMADRIRDELLEKGVILEDTKEGVRWKKK